jgi:hypothetical protein
MKFINEAKQSIKGEKAKRLFVLEKYRNAAFGVKQ